MNQMGRFFLSAILAALALSALWLFLTSAQPALATPPIGGDPVSTGAAMDIFTATQPLTSVVAVDLNNDGRQGTYLRQRQHNGHCRVDTHKYRRHIDGAGGRTRGS
jgi:hypothetical protein